MGQSEQTIELVSAKELELAAWSFKIGQSSNIRQSLVRSRPAQANQYHPSDVGRTSHESEYADKSDHTEESD